MAGACKSGFRPAGEPCVFSPNRIRSSVIDWSSFEFLRNNVFTHKNVPLARRRCFLPFFRAFVVQRGFVASSLHVC